ncbi:MAG: Clp protease N-terminal domain-containing protein [Acidimicrobiia bacterium]
MFELFTDRSRRVVVLAQEEARLLNHDYIGTEHLLLGVVHEGESTAAIALRRVGLTLQEARAAVEAFVGRGEASESAATRFRSGAKTALELALREATHPSVAAPQERAAKAGRGVRPWLRRVARTRDDICPEHILLGLIEEGGVAVEVLDHIGVDLAEIRQAVIDEMRNDRNTDEERGDAHER